MVKLPKIYKLSASLALALAAALVAAIKYPGFIHYNEQMQMFLLTPGYFFRAVSVPGGLADWASEFLVQFFTSTAAGAVIVALLLAGVQILTSALCRRETPLSFVLSFLPAVAAGAFLTGNHAMLTAVVSLVCSLGAALALRRAPEALRAALVPIVYMIAGPLAIVYAAVLLLDCITSGKPASGVCSLALAVLCPLGAALIWPYPLGRILAGIHYVREIGEPQTWIWLAAAFSLISICCDALLKAPERVRVWPGAICIAAILAAGLPVCTTERAAETERTFLLDYLVRSGNWDAVIEATGPGQPANNYTRCARNFALSCKGLLLDELFSVPQSGLDCLVLSDDSGLFPELLNSEIFYHMGMVSISQRYAFEASSGTPDYRCSCRSYLQLARTNLVNGYFRAAVKYIEPLTHTLKYRKEALEMMEMARSRKLSGECAAVHSIAPRGFDTLYKQEDLDKVLGMMMAGNPRNSAALQYMFSVILLKKDLQKFGQCMNAFKMKTPPRICREAAALMPEGFAGIAGKQNMARFSKFRTDASSGKDASYMRRTYGNTYWFYFFSRQENEQK